MKFRDFCLTWICTIVTSVPAFCNAENGTPQDAMQFTLEDAIFPVFVGPVPFVSKPRLTRNSTSPSSITDDLLKKTLYTEESNVTDPIFIILPKSMNLLSPKNRDMTKNLINKILSSSQVTPDEVPKEHPAELLQFVSLDSPTVTEVITHDKGESINAAVVPGQGKDSYYLQVNGPNVNILPSAANLLFKEIGLAEQIQFSHLGSEKPFVQKTGNLEDRGTTLPVPEQGLAGIRFEASSLTPLGTSALISHLALSPEVLSSSGKAPASGSKSANNPAGPPQSSANEKFTISALMNLSDLLPSIAGGGKDHHGDGIVPSVSMLPNAYTFTPSPRTEDNDMMSSSQTQYSNLLRHAPLNQIRGAELPVPINIAFPSPGSAGHLNNLKIYPGFPVLKTKDTNRGTGSPLGEHFSSPSSGNLIFREGSTYGEQTNKIVCSPVTATVFQTVPTYVTKQLQLEVVTETVTAPRYVTETKYNFDTIYSTIISTLPAYTHSVTERIPVLTTMFVSTIELMTVTTTVHSIWHSTVYRTVQDTVIETRTLTSFSTMTSTVNMFETTSVTITSSLMVTETVSRSVINYSTVTVTSTILSTTTRTLSPYLTRISYPSLSTYRSTVFYTTFVPSTVSVTVTECNSRQYSQFSEIFDSARSPYGSRPPESNIGHYESFDDNVLPIQETFARELDQQGFHIDAYGVPKNPDVLNKSWPKSFIIDDRLWSDLEDASPHSSHTDRQDQGVAENTSIASS